MLRGIEQSTGVGSPTGRPGIRGAIVLVFVAACVLSAPAGARAGEAEASYYLVVFAAQEEGNKPETSHCFATFARVERAVGASPGPRVGLHEINWFSVRGHRNGRTHGLFEDDGRPVRPERGENRPVRDALRLAQRLGLRVTRWGPYEIDRRLYERAGRQVELLEGRVPGREVLYKALDVGYREGPEVRALNCIHAVSDVDREAGPLRTWTSYGDGAARKVVLHLRRWFKDAGAERDDDDAWGPIWDATWRGERAPARLVVVRGEPPWGDGDVPPSTDVGTVAGTGSKARAGSGAHAGRPVVTTRVGGG